MIGFLGFFLILISPVTYAQVAVVDLQTNAVIAVDPKEFKLAFYPLQSVNVKKLGMQGKILLAKPIKQALGGSQTTHVEIDGNTLNVDFFSLEETIDVDFVDGSKQKLRVTSAVKKFKSFDDQCLKNNIRLKLVRDGLKTEGVGLQTAAPVSVKSEDLVPQTAAPPSGQAARPKVLAPAFSYGISCGKFENKYFLAISFPAEVEWIDSTIYESAGKGEAWRYYELSSNVREDGNLGSLTVRSKGVDYRFVVQSAKEVEKKDQRKSRSFFSDLTLGFGTRTLGFDAGTVKAEADSAGLSITTLTRPFWLGFYLGAEYSANIATTADVNSMKFTDMVGHLGYGFWRPTFVVLSYGYLKVADFVHNETQTRLQTILGGTALKGELTLLRAHTLGLKYEMGLFRSAEVQSSSGYEGYYQYQWSTRSPFRMGLSVGHQEFIVVNTAQSERVFSESSMGIRMSWIGNF